MISVERFASRCERILGSGNVLRDGESLARYERNLSGFRRRVMTVVMPGSADEVREVVGAAVECGVSIFPISRGANWGLGSRLPNRSDGAVVDLSRIRAIRGIDLAAGTAFIETGVTQAQLAAALTDGPYFVDVTGSARETSVIGNALERGVAYNGLRADSLSALEVVLGTGELLRTGYGRFPTARSELGGANGAGPSMEGLFLQSNFGIVTAGIVRLWRRPAFKLGFTLTIDDEAALPELLARMADLKGRGVLPGIPHVFNRERFFSAVAGLYRTESVRCGRPRSRDRIEGFLGRRLSGGWWAVGHLNGERAIANAARTIVNRELRGLGRLEFMTDRKWTWLERIVRVLRREDDLILMRAVEAVRGFSCGEPADAGLYSTFWPWVEDVERRNVVDPDSGPGGLVYAVSALAPTASHVRRLVALTREICLKRGFRPAISLNVVSQGFAEAVLSVDFPRDDAEAGQAARACITELNRVLLLDGYPPFRLDIDNQEMASIDGDVFGAVAKRIKIAMDPHGIVAPGRYGLE